MIEFEENFRNESIMEVAQKIALAARTAPKARGTDNLKIAIVSGDTQLALSEKMKQCASKYEMPSFERDAKNVEFSTAVILIGSKIDVLGLNCGYCGFPTCAEKNQHPKVPCFFNANDLGIAIGSAVSLAADFRIDNRVMFTVGKAAQELNVLPECDMILGIPLSATRKSPFFDRK